MENQLLSIKVEIVHTTGWKKSQRFLQNFSVIVDWKLERTNPITTHEKKHFLHIAKKTSILRINLKTFVLKNEIKPFLPLFESVRRPLFKFTLQEPNHCWLEKAILTINARNHIFNCKNNSKLGALESFRNHRSNFAKLLDHEYFNPTTLHWGKQVLTINASRNFQKILITSFWPKDYQKCYPSQ